MSRAYPCLFIESYDKALPFYVDFLGFKVDFEWRHEEGLPVYMGISRGLSPGIKDGEVATHLTEHKVPEGVGILLDVEDVGEFYSDLNERNPEILQTAARTWHGAELVVQPWGKTELHLQDPFNNGLIFTSKTE